MRRRDSDISEFANINQKELANYPPPFVHANTQPVFTVPLHTTTTTTTTTTNNTTAHVSPITASFKRRSHSIGPRDLADDPRKVPHPKIIHRDDVDPPKVENKSIKKLVFED